MVNSGLSLSARLAAAEPTAQSPAQRAHASTSSLLAMRHVRLRSQLTWVVASRRSVSLMTVPMLSSHNHQPAVHARSALPFRLRTSASHTHTLVSARSAQIWASLLARLHTLPLNTGWINVARLLDVATAPLSQHAQLQLHQQPHHQLLAQGLLIHLCQQ